MKKIKMKLFFSMLITCFSIGYIYAQEEVIRPFHQKQLCYKAYSVTITPPQNIVETITFAQYIGTEDWEDLKDKGVEEVSVEITSERQEWQNEEGNDCSSSVYLVRKKIPQEIKKIIVVKDTNVVKDFNIIHVKKNNFIAGVYSEEKKQCLCEDKITPAFRQRLKNTLIAKGYFFKENIPTTTCELIEVLNAFQRKNNLSIDSNVMNRLTINIETLHVLGIFL